MSCPYRLECPQKVRDHQAHALKSTIFILRNLGPLGFLLKEENEPNEVKVLLGNPHRCTCLAFQRDKDLCRHICWILLKRFKLKEDESLSYQLGLSDRDIDQIIQRQKQPPIQVGTNNIRANDDKSEEKDPQQTSSDFEPNFVDQKPLCDDDICPICQENLLQKHWPVTYCRYSCGNNIHIRCMKVWADHQLKMESFPLSNESKEQMVKCPYCRGDFCTLSVLKADFTNDPTRHVRFCKEVKSHKNNSPVIEETKNSIVLSTIEIDYSEDSGEEKLKSHTRKILQAVPTMKLPPECQLLKQRQQCCLCLQRFQAGNLVGRLPCRHRFHRKCLAKWFSENHVVCPIDGFPVETTTNQSSGGNKKNSKENQLSMNSISLMISGLAFESLKLPPIVGDGQPASKSFINKRVGGLGTEKKDLALGNSLERRNNSSHIPLPALDGVKAGGNTGKGRRSGSKCWIPAITDHGQPFVLSGKKIQ